MTAPAARTGFRPAVERLLDRVTPDAAALWDPNSALVLGPDDGGPPVLHLIGRTGRTTELQVYDPAFRGGVRHAVGDVTGDGIDDLITAAGAGGAPHVKVYDGKTGGVRREFFAYDPAFTGGAELAVGDVNRDGRDDIITGAGPGGGPHVRVFDALSGKLLTEFLAFEAGFRGGVFVASGDLDVDGYDDVIVGAGSGGGPRVTAVDSQTGGRLFDFFPLEARFRGGVRVASADVTGDGVDDLITAAGPGGGPRVKVHDLTTGKLVSDRFVGDTASRNGVRLDTAAVVQRNGKAEVVAVTRDGDSVQATVYGPDTGDWTYSAWVGDGTPPNGTAVFVPGVVAGGVQPVRTIEGTILTVASDGSAMTVRRGDGTSVEIDMDGDPPPPPGEVYIDLTQLPPATVHFADETRPISALTPGTWVRVRVARAFNPAATRFQALDVRML